MGKTSNEVKRRWMNSNYKIYHVQLRIEDDKELINFIESKKGTVGTTQMFREAMEMYKEVNEER